MIEYIRTAAFALLLSLAAGLCACSPEEDLREMPESYPIGFSIRTPLLKSGGSASLKDAFANGDAIKVYGKRNHDFQVFNGQVVTRGAVNWSYSPLKFWNWENDTDSYSFLAVYPSTATVNAADYLGHISEKVVYDYEPDGTEDQYDLMMAGQRRLFIDEDNNAAVPLVFEHMTSAVQVVFRNRSASMSVTVDSYGFKNLSTVATAHCFYNAGGDFTLVRHWDDVESGFNDSDVILPHNSLSQTLAAFNGSTYASYSGAFDLFIPQDLNYDASSPAKLIVHYTPEGGSAKTAEVVLKDVYDQSGAAFNSTWEMGNKYIYNIYFNLDGGIVVTVITTQWDTIEAETPGLLL